MNGFIGTRERTIATAGDGHHQVTLAEYRFPGGDLCPYVEVSDTERAGSTKVLALSTTVMLAQNLSDEEIWQICARSETPAAGKPTAGELLYDKSREIDGLSETWSALSAETRRKIEELADGVARHLVNQILTEGRVEIPDSVGSGFEFALDRYARTKS